jgi:ADP-ribose pyrophosphatase
MKQLNIKTLYKKHYNLEEISLEHGGKIIYRERINKQDAVAGIVLNTNTNKYILVSQWRPGTLSEILEIPAGTLDKEGEPKEECMKREVLEETGYKVDTIKELVPEFIMSPGYTNEKMTIFYCTVSIQVNTQLGVDDEDIKLVELEESEIPEKVRDAKSLIAYYALKHKA